MKNTLNYHQSVNKIRYNLLDTFRGILVIEMVLYHAAWDWVYLLGNSWAFYQSKGGYIWQQSICWLFIFLSGFCFSLGKKPLKRGITVFFAGAVVSLVTILFMPQNAVMFGILTFIGSAMIALALIEKCFNYVPNVVGFCGSLILFFITRNINIGQLGFEGIVISSLPSWLYASWLTTFLGFTHEGFYSTDYFSFLPWFFLFVSGYFAFRMLKGKNILDKYCQKGISPLNFVGKNALIIYLLHQPVLYALISIYGAITSGQMSG